MKLKQLLVIPFISMFLVGCDPNASLPDYQKVDTIYTFTDFAKYSGYMSVSPSLGESKLLVIPVWFTDSSDFIANKDNVRNDIETAYIGTSALISVLLKKLVGKVFVHITRKIPLEELV